MRGVPLRIKGNDGRYPRLALLETGNPPETLRQFVTEGERQGNLRVVQIAPEGVVLEEGLQRFLVPLTPLAPRPIVAARAFR